MNLSFLLNEVVEKLGEVNYPVRQPGRKKPRQIYHVNLLKRRAVFPHSPPAVSTIPDLPPIQYQHLKELVDPNRDVFSEIPGRTTVIAHDIQTPPATVVRLRLYRIPEAQWKVVQEEVRNMLELKNCTALGPG